MSKFTSFDRKNLNDLRAELEAVLAKYGVGSNLQFTVGGMKYTSADVEIKVSAKIKGAKTVNDTLLESRIRALGLVMEKNGAKLVRYDARKFKFPFIYEKNGQLYKTSEDRAKLLFAA